MSKEEQLDILGEIFAADVDGILDMPQKPQPLTGQGRLERSFLEINEFVESEGREPDPTTRKIQERKLGARLEGIRAQPEKSEVLRPLDVHGLLRAEESAPVSLDDILNMDTDLLSDPTGILNTSTLPTPTRRSEPEWIAKREVCKNFEVFEPLFKQKQEELRSGAAGLSPKPVERHIEEGTFFVLGGLMLFVADVGESEIVAGRRKERLRVIFENGTESSMYRQSLTSRLHEDDSFLVTQRDITVDELEPGDELTGHIYVLRSLSHHPEVTARPDLHKIGFTRGPVQARVANAKNETTFLMAPVEVAAEYRTYNLKASALEHLVHKVFGTARIPFEQVGQKGTTSEPSEWFDVPLDAIDHALTLMMNGEIVNWRYDTEQRRLVPLSKES